MMRTFTTIAETTVWREAQGSYSVGFVPTMGYLHEGHLSLVRRAREENDRVVVSIFVNPTQFGPNEDFDAYPRDLTRDSELLRSVGTDVVFAPTAKEEMYPHGYATYVTVEGTLTQGLCGASRPGHFRGVTTVVAKLFGIVRPNRAYFGEKDYQQLTVIRQMTADLNLGVEIVGCPTVREPDGLAMSSRNAYLSPEERKSAVSLHAALNLAETRIRDGARDANALTAELLEHFARVPYAQVDYVSFVDADSLAPVERLEGRTQLALAVFVGKTRLIDNRRFHTAVGKVGTPPIQTFEISVADSGGMR